VNLVKEVVELDCVDSTNSYALASAKVGLVVTARLQTAGRGRRGATWFSPGGSNLYMSLTVNGSNPRYTVLSGVAIWEAIRSIIGQGHDIRIKWPNDIYVDDKKASGILCEAKGGITAIGVGINVNQESWPEELEDRAISLKEATGLSYNIDDVLKASLSFLEKWFFIYNKDGFYPIRHAFLGYSRIKGTVVLIQGDIEGRVIDMDMNGQLVVKTPGSIKYIDNPAMFETQA